MYADEGPLLQKSLPHVVYHMSNEEQSFFDRSSQAIHCQPVMHISDMIAMRFHMFATTNAIRAISSSVHAFCVKVTSNFLCPLSALQASTKSSSDKFQLQSGFECA